MRPDGGSTINPGLVVDERYRIIEPLGRGGMGSVYRAEHIGLKRPIAIKLLNRELRSYKASNERLVREAFATGRLDHPNCVAIMDLGELGDGTPYLAMELLEGRSLSDTLEQQQHLPVERALRITRHLLFGLAHAHEAGVVHRDLKPDNIFLVHREGDRDSEPGFPKILDFGIAKLTGEAMVQEGGNELTEAGMAIGSPTYMSPEQALGGEIDPRTDLYSLSVVLYEMLAGRPPFDAPDDKLAVLRMHLTAPVPAFAEVAPDIAVPEAVETLVRRGLAKQADERFQSAEEYGQHVDTALRGVAQTHAAPAVASAHRDSDDAAPTAGLGAPAPSGTLPRALAAATAMLSSARATLVAAPRPALIAGGVGLGLLAIIVAVVALGGGDASDGSAGDLADADGAARPSDDTMVFLTDELADVDVSGDLDDQLDRYEELIDDGRGAWVAGGLASAARRHPDDARAQLLLGRANMDREYWRDGFDAFRRALELDGSLRDDDKLIRSALRSLTSVSRPELGIQFLVRDIGEPAVPYLEETVEDSASKRQRENAARALRALEQSR